MLLAAAQPDAMQEPTTEPSVALQREPSDVTLYVLKQLVQHAGMEYAAVWPAKVTATIVARRVLVVNMIGDLDGCCFGEP